MFYHEAHLLHWPSCYLMYVIKKQSKFEYHSHREFIIFRLSVWKDLFWRRVLRLISVTYLGKPWRQVFSCMIKRNNILDLIYLYTSLSFANEELWCNCIACVNCKCACRHGSHPGACTALFCGWISLNLMVISTEYKTVTTHKMK